MSELLPCPFCGSTNIRDDSFDGGSSNPEWFECADCGCVGPSAFTSGQDFDAAGQWNRRASPWRYPDRGDPMPEDFQRILYVYRNTSGEESLEIATTFRTVLLEHACPMIRWMPIPADTPTGEEA